MFLFGYILGVASVVAPLAYLYVKGFIGEWVKDHPASPIAPKE